MEGERVMQPEQKLRDYDIRSVLHADTLHPFHADETTKVIDEFVVGSEDARIDIAAINGHLFGYEIKSDADSLERLPLQVIAYNKVFDYLSLVVGDRFLAKAHDSIPSWWGILHARHEDGEITIKCVRSPKQNNELDPISIGNLLWLEEARTILENKGFAKGFKSKPKREVIEKLAFVLNVDELKDEVRNALKSRVNWRSGSQQTQYAGSRRSGPKSLDSRAKNLERFLSRQSAYPHR